MSHPGTNPAFSQASVFRNPVPYGSCNKIRVTFEPLRVLLELSELRVSDFLILVKEPLEK